MAFLEVAGQLGSVVDDLDRAIQLALAERPRGVVCDLSAIPEGVGPCTIQMLATSGRHVRSWPGTPVAVACADPRFRAELSAQSRGGHLIVASSTQEAVSALLATPDPEVDCLRLSPEQTVSRESQDFIARALLAAGLGPLIPAASLVVSELVNNSASDAGSDIELSVQWHLGLLRLTVRDNRPEQVHQRYPQFVDRQGRGLSVVAALSRTFGVLPTADGGKVVWAVLNAARPSSPLPSIPARLARDGLDANVTVTSEQPKDIYQGGTP
ncbi:MAG: ATP-binding protein [Dermatophilaceae bacterium]